MLRCSCGSWLKALQNIKRFRCLYTHQNSDLKGQIIHKGSWAAALTSVPLVGLAAGARLICIVRIIHVPQRADAENDACDVQAAQHQLVIQPIIVSPSRRSCSTVSQAAAKPCGSVAASGGAARNGMAHLRRHEVHTRGAPAADTAGFRTQEDKVCTHDWGKQCAAREQWLERPVHAALNT